MYGLNGLGPSQQASSASYGAMGNNGITFGDSGKASMLPFQQRVRPRVGFMAVLLCFAAPCVVFVVVCGALSFPVRLTSPALSWAAVGLAAVACVGCAYNAASTVWRRWCGQSARDPFWYVFLAVTMLAAWGSAEWLGELNWWNNVVPYINLQSMSSRNDVDPATTVGMQLMDVGRVTFAEGSRIDLNRSMGFKNVDEYCVAPIVRDGSTPPESYDLWAIGMNCCSGNAADFHCGDFNNTNARAGLRIVREDQRAFYRLAVQQAEATYNMRAEHPLFFYWMEDPKTELEAYKEDAQHYFLLGSLSFVAAQILMVLVGLVVHAKL